MSMTLVIEPQLTSNTADNRLFTRLLRPIMSAKLIAIADSGSVWSVAAGNRARCGCLSRPTQVGHDSVCLQLFVL